MTPAAARALALGLTLAVLALGGLAVYLWLGHHLGPTP